MSEVSIRDWRNLVATTRRQRSSRQAVLQQAEADFEPLPFDAQSARAFGRVAASLRVAGRKVQARGYDAMIAVTAIANDDRSACEL